MKLQEDIGLGCRAKSWASQRQRQYNSDYKARKRVKKIDVSYTFGGTILDKVEKIEYHGITITSDLKWNTHVSNIYTKANRAFGCLRRNLVACPHDVKELAYKGLARPGVW